jgi:tripartite-type tricarboxylate transporter receptor subunit TctC
MRCCNIREATAVCLATVVLFADGPARADSVADFYKGKTVTITVGTEAGNSYDVYTRTLARHLSRHTPGNPSFIVQNAPGAGGLNNANAVYNVASKDGLSLGQVQNTVPFEPFYGNQNARFDATKMNWLGTPGRETGLLIVWHTVPVNSLADAKSRGLVLGATGVTSTPAFYARVITAMFGIPVKLIAGYKSQSESFLAMERGENDGYSSTFWSSLKLAHPEWISDKKIKMLLQYGGEPAPELKDVPFATDILTNPEDKRLMLIASAPLALGRPIFAPPGVPAERVAALRKAAADTYRDSEYLADCAQQRLECTKPASGAEITDLLSAAYAAPAATRKRLQDIYFSGR